MNHDPGLSIALKMLPPRLFRDTVARLTGGQNVRRVARWLMTQDRGELQHLGFYDVRKQVAQLEGRIDRNEDASGDPPPEPQAGQTRAVPSAYEVHLQKLQEMAMTDSLTGREVLNFVLCTELDRVRDLLQTGGSHGQVSSVLHHVRRIAEQLPKVGAGASTAWENFDKITIEDADSERVQQLSERVKQMSTADRMLARHGFGLYRSILKLQDKLEQEKLQEKQARETPAPPPEET